MCVSPSNALGGRSSAAENLADKQSLINIAPPSVPPIPNSPSSIATPPPPSKIPPSSNTAAGRQILKPVFLPKFPILERPFHNNRSNSENANAFILQELAEIIATRQRRERAWHARLIICTTKLKKLALKSYLRQAVANFATADSLTSPPRVQSHTRSNRGNGKGEDKEMNMNMDTTKKVAVATPKNMPSQGSNRASMKEAEQLRVMLTTINSWVIVACNGQKKARTTYTHDLPVNTGIRGT
ncbi:hypothetical protein EPUL_002909 [Erysiphe pulchra]|uniref:Uncharacterized protein n=1 Tax=Erysiphe pulchra TaxID=225359 RepID=A0A2S4Q053_9PEZI|nr:hypothetical protein EPUL_002909 [Erysiphe pulchra]